MLQAQESTERKAIYIEKACEIAKVSRRTMYYWIKEGRVETRRVAGSLTQLVYLDSLEEHLVTYRPHKHKKRRVEGVTSTPSASLLPV
jgi:predicted site-specific integrase-resolvase